MKWCITGVVAAKNYLTREELARVPSFISHGVAVEHFPHYHVDPDLSECPSHAHDAVYLSYLHSGQTQHMIDGQVYNEKAGDLAIVHYDVEHGIMTPDGPVAVTNIYLDPERHHLLRIEENFARRLLQVLPFNRALQYRQNTLHHVPGPIDGPLDGVIRSMILEQEQGAEHYETALLMQLQLVFLQIVRRSEFITDKEELIENDDPEMEALRQWLHKEIQRVVSIQECCEKSNLSRSQLGRRFKLHTGLSIGNYVLQKRMENVFIDLRASKKRIIDIAFDCGFSDLAYFNRKFKLMAGMSPREYRKQFGSANS